MTRREWFILTFALAVFGGMFLSGCGTFAPCWYDGKAVTQHDANIMKNLGMSVTCPGDENQFIPCNADNCGKPTSRGYRYLYDGSLEVCKGDGIFHPCFAVESDWKGTI
jgi:hypothetical protein